MMPELANITIRRKGRHKLKMLMDEATEICRKYDHQEYTGDFKQINDGLIHDTVVEYTQQREAWGSSPATG